MRGRVGSYVIVKIHVNLGRRFGTVYVKLCEASDSIVSNFVLVRVGFMTDCVRDMYLEVFGVIRRH